MKVCMNWEAIISSAMWTSTRKLTLLVRLLPFIILFGYLNFTVICFAFGPWPWPVEDGTKIYIFLAFAHLAFSVGYFSAALGRPRSYYGPWQIERIVTFSVIISIALLFPTSLFRTNSIIPDICSSLKDLGGAYYTYNNWRANGAQGIEVEYARIIFGPVLFLLFPLTVYYWQLLKWRIRLLSLSCTIGMVAIYVAVGTNKAIADFVLLTPFMLTASYLAGYLQVNLRRIFLGSLICVAGFSFFMAFFTMGQVSRLRTETAMTHFLPLDIYADKDNFLVKYLPDDAKLGMIALTNYLTQGYYGLYLSLDKPFVPTYGVGNSMFLINNIAELLGDEEIAKKPYPFRLKDKGWSGYGNWASIYAWIASDVSFYGAVVVCFVVGMFFALSWLDTLKGANPFAVGSFAQFIIMLFYFPANNQVVQTGEALTSFYGILTLWLLTRTKFVWNRP